MPSNYAPRITKEEFAFRFNRAFEAKKKRIKAKTGVEYGLLTVARNIDPENPQRTRRSLQRYRNHGAHLPNIVMRRKLASELEVSFEEFGAADDPDDPPSVEPDAARVDADLLGELRAMKRRLDRIERRVVLAK